MESYNTYIIAVKIKERYLIKNAFRSFNTINCFCRIKTLVGRTHV